MILSIIGGVVGGLLLMAFIASIGGLTIKGPGAAPTCTRGYCDAWRHASCGAGHCAHHCDLYCSGKCIDPRPVPQGKPGYRPTVIKGGAA